MFLFYLSSPFFFFYRKREFVFLILKRTRINYYSSYASVPARSCWYLCLFFSLLPCSSARINSTCPNQENKIFKTFYIKIIWNSSQKISETRCIVIFSWKLSEKSCEKGLFEKFSETIITLFSIYYLHLIRENSSCWQGYTFFLQATRFQPSAWDFGQKLSNCLATARPQIWNFLQKQLIFTCKNQP